MAKAMRVLHVDDDQAFLELSVANFDRLGPEIDLVSSTEPTQALDWIIERPFDCVISDYEMPGLNGLDLLQKLRTHRPNLPFILFTGEGSESIASEAISAGVTDYLQKTGRNAQFSLLKNKIERIIERDRHRRRLVELVEESPDVLWMTDPKFEEILFINTAVEEVFARPIEPVREQPTLLVDMVDAEHREQADRAMEQLSNGLQVDFECRLTGKGATWVQVKGKPILDADARVVRVLGYIRDITGIKRRTERLQVFEQMVNAMNDVVFVVDGDGQFRVVNDRLLQLTGSHREDWIGEPIAALALRGFVSADQMDRLSNAFQLVLHTDNADVSESMRLGDGFDIDEVEVRLVPFEAELLGTAVLGTMRSTEGTGAPTTTGIRQGD